MKMRLKFIQENVYSYYRKGPKRTKPLNQSMRTTRFRKWEKELATF